MVDKEVERQVESAEETGGQPRERERGGELTPQPEMDETQKDAPEVDHPPPAPFTKGYFFQGIYYIDESDYLRAVRDEAEERVGRQEYRGRDRDAFEQ